MHIFFISVAPSPQSKFWSRWLIFMILVRILWQWSAPVLLVLLKQVTEASSPLPVGKEEGFLKGQDYFVPEVTLCYMCPQKQICHFSLSTSHLLQPGKWPCIKFLSSHPTHIYHSCSAFWWLKLSVLQFLPTQTTLYPISHSSGFDWPYSLQTT